MPSKILWCPSPKGWEVTGPRIQGPQDFFYPGWPCGPGNTSQVGNQGQEGSEVESAGPRGRLRPLAHTPLITGRPWLPVCEMGEQRLPHRWTPDLGLGEGELHAAQPVMSSEVTPRGLGICDPSLQRLDLPELQAGSLVQGPEPGKMEGVCPRVTWRPTAGDWPGLM